MREAIFGNVGPIVFFGVDAREADILAHEPDRTHNAATVAKLENQRAYAKLVDASKPDPPAFTGEVCSQMRGA